MSRLVSNDFSADPPRAVSAAGVWVTDATGKRYLDGCSGAVVSNIGHGHPAVVAAIREQAGRLTFAHRTSFGTDQLHELADRLTGWTSYDAAWFVNSGSEATEAAIQFAVQYFREIGQPERSWFLSFERGYHGNTLGGLSLSGNARRTAIEGLVHDFPTLPVPYAYRDQGGLSDDDWAEQLLSRARAEFERAGERLAGVVFEPVGGATMGATVPPIRYLQGLREICDEYGVVLIADEVMTGIGRCGTPMALAQFGIEADIAMTGKGLGAGYTPIAATLLRARVRDAIGQGSGRVLGGHTYSGNPLSAASALAVLDVLISENVVERSAREAERLMAGLRAIANRSDVVGEARGLGMLMAIEPVADKQTRRFAVPQGKLAQQIYRHAKDRGLILYPTTGGVNDALLVAPPLTIDSAETDFLLEALEDALAAL